MKLSVKDRFAIQRITPQQGTFDELIVAKDINDKIAFTQKDLEKYKMKNITVKDEDGKDVTRVQWNEENEKGKEVEFTDREKELILKGFEEIDKKKEATPDLITTYLLFKN